MANHKDARLSSIITLAAEYSTPYSAVIREDIVMGVPRYFLERWVPILGTNAATVVNTLRQLNYRCHNDTITISGSDLAREAAMSRRHLYTCLQTPWIEAFITAQSGERMRNHEGQVIQQANCYKIRIDDPLTPADADRLLTILRNLADTPFEAAQQALDYPPRELWASDPRGLQSTFSQPRGLLAIDVIQRAFPTWQAQTPEQKNSLATLAEQLHRHITLVNETGRSSKIIVPQYFRRQWWEKLGHDLAWSYLWLRGQVYNDEAAGIHRDTCWIPALDTLLSIIGRTREWWRRNVENIKPSHEDWQLTNFFEQLETQKGRDAAHPQWVARKFRIALTIPIAPNDRDVYSRLMDEWPSSSATTKHTGPEGVLHNQTHRPPKYPPQTNTPAPKVSATNEHTGLKGVCHSDAQGSAITKHSESESLKIASLNITEETNTNQQPVSETTVFKKTADAGVIPNGSESQNNEQASKLIDQLAWTLENEPTKPLYQVVPVMMWLQQAWSEPIRPHTPIWTLVIGEKITGRELVALMLAVWADSAIKHPPRYLSWLGQRWQDLKEMPPVDHWPQWLALAQLPIGEWYTVGRKQWLELAARERRFLPFGLDVLEFEQSNPAEEFHEDEASEFANLPVQLPMTDVSQPNEIKSANDSNGLDQRPGDGRLSVYDIWRATLGQLSLQLNRSTYANWVEGARAISYADGVLTVQARHSLARDWLDQRLNRSIEAVASDLAETPIKICYIATP